MSHTKKLTVAAMCVALAFALNQVTLYRMPQGGSITPASMLFIVLAGYWLGPVYGILAGISKGILDTVLTPPYILHPIQFVLDYPLAFGMLGLSGFFRKMPYGLQIGYIAGVTGRFVMVFLSGLVFFVDVGNVGVVTGSAISAVYNITYIGPEMAFTLVIISLPAMRHAIDVVTKSIVSHEDYVLMSRSYGSITQRARLVTGTIMGALGGLAFVLVSYITRLENFAIMQLATGAELFREAPTRVYRMLERNTGQIAGLQVVGVLFLAIGIGLVVSVLMRGEVQGKAGGVEPCVESVDG